MNLEPELLPYLLAAGALVVGLVLGRMTAHSRGPQGALGQAEHRLRSAEAQLRVAQRSAEQEKAAREQAAAERDTLRADVASMKEQAEQRSTRILRLEEELRHECKKTAKLRDELAARAEEMVRTHVRLRETTDELDVVKMGGDVIVDQISRLEREREDLAELVENLKRELEVAQSGTVRSL